MRRLAALLTLTVTVSAFAQGPYRSSITYESYEGLVMAGYQGWFNTPGDGAGRNWHHYEKGRRFEPGWCTIDLWPEVDEYPQLYETAFRFEDGTPAYVPSPYDKSTVDVHFRWMQEYGLDGVFLQRFIAEIANSSGKKHFNKVMDSAMECANKYDRAVAIMYDLSGMPANGPEILLKDIDALAKAHHLFDHRANPSYLYQNGKPLVTVWGVGFNDNRKYGFDECEKIIDGLKARGYSVMIGVPTHWRTLSKDTLPDERLHALIRKCDIVMPWFRLCAPLLPGFLLGQHAAPRTPRRPDSPERGAFFQETAGLLSGQRRQDALHRHVRRDRRGHGHLQDRPESTRGGSRKHLRAPGGRHSVGPLPHPCRRGGRPAERQAGEAEPARLRPRPS